MSQKSNTVYGSLPVFAPSKPFWSSCYVGIRTHSLCPQPSSSPACYPGGWRCLSDPHQHCSAPATGSHHSCCVPSVLDGWKQWEKWQTWALHDQARRWSDTGSLSVVQHQDSQSIRSREQWACNILWLVVFMVFVFRLLLACSIITCPAFCIASDRKCKSGSGNKATVKLCLHSWQWSCEYQSQHEAIHRW